MQSDAGCWMLVSGYWQKKRIIIFYPASSIQNQALLNAVPFGQFNKASIAKPRRFEAKLR